MLSYIFFSNLYTFPHLTITFLTKPPHLWPGLLLIYLLSSLSPHCVWGDVFQMHIPPVHPPQLRLCFKASIAALAFRIKTKTQAPKALTLLLGLPAYLATFSLAL